MTAFVLGLPEHKVRVIAPDVGGGFGSKIYLYAEDAVVTWASQAGQPPDQVDRRAQRVVPVRRARPRPRHPGRARARQGRQVPRDARAHHREHGRLPVDVRLVHPDRSSTRRCSPASTRRPAIYCEVTAVFTNTAPVDAYRGAGRPEATYVVERIVETAARDMKHGPGRDPPAQLHHARFPYQTPVALHLRHRRLRRDARPRRMKIADVDGLPGAQGRSGEARQAARPRLSPATSRPAASRRRPSPARSARAPACSRPARCACTRPAR